MNLFAIRIKHRIDLDIFSGLHNIEKLKYTILKASKNETILYDIVLCNDIKSMILFRSIEKYVERCIDAKTLKFTVSIIKWCIPISYESDIR